MDDEAGVRTFLTAMAPIDGARVMPGRASARSEDEDDFDVDPSEPTDPGVSDPNAPYVPASDDPIDNPFITTP